MRWQDEQSREKASRLAEVISQEDGWGECGEAQYDLIEDVEKAHGPLQHRRVMPLPLRVKSGTINEAKLSVETANESIDIPWSKVRLVALGMVCERSEVEPEAYQLQRMVRGMVKGKGKDDDKIVNIRETNLMDLYVDGIDEPIRFDSAHVNYRSLLPSVSFVSFQNFFRLVHTVASHCPSAMFTPSVVHFLQWKRDKLQRFGALHDFEDDTQSRLAALDKQVPFDQLDFSRRTWAQEWSD